MWIHFTLWNWFPTIKCMQFSSYFSSTFFGVLSIVFIGILCLSLCMRSTNWTITLIHSKQEQHRVEQTEKMYIWRRRKKQSPHDVIPSIFLINFDLPLLRTNFNYFNYFSLFHFCVSFISSCFNMFVFRLKSRSCSRI